ncbi:hypothetical protein FB556_2192 [Enteractinococcus coprophilus]|uniref:Uncharacterized protein n=1 Tax=Enteractinococcus coprophilus TaxID=1027633 RepID=A0A543AGL3_9MICC|nr:hypothetical protein FB556_2192 [Enteractinococcus coprophilus]
MGAFFKMWWMFWWRMSVVTWYLGYNGVGPGFLISGMIAAVIAFQAQKTIVIFPVIQQFYGDGAIQDRRHRVKPQRSSRSSRRGPLGSSQ